MEMKLTTICNNDPQDHLQDVSRERSILSIELNDAWLDRYGKHYFMFDCGCSYTSSFTGIAYHKRNTACEKHFKDITIPHLVKQIVLS